MIGVGVDFIPDISLTWVDWLLLVVGAVGLILLLAIANAMRGPAYIQVPPGVPPDRYYREWKAKAWSRRFSRSFFLLAGIALGMSLGGCGTILVKVIG